MADDVARRAQYENEMVSRILALGLNQSLTIVELQSCLTS
jgi:hypothetical protein